MKNYKTIVKDVVWINVYWTITDVYWDVRDIISNNVNNTVWLNVRDNVRNIIWNKVWKPVKLFEYNDLEQYRNNL